MPSGRPHLLRASLLLLAALLWVGAGAPPAAAHGILERSDPAANASLDAPPRQVVLWFNEPVDATFSSATVADAQGRRVSRDAALSADRRVLQVPVGDLSSGLYTVRWRVLSAVDGHTTSGAFVFAVGQAVPTGLGGSEPAPPAPGTVAVRWAAFLGAIVLAGNIFFQAVVLHQALRGTDAEIAATVRATTTPRLRRLQVSAALLLLISAIVGFALTATSLLEMPLLRALPRGLLGPLLLDTKVGWSILIIIPFTVLLLLPPSRWGRIVRSGGLILIVGLAGLAALFRGPASLRESGHGLHLVVTVGFAAAYALVTAVRRPPAVDWISAVVAAGLLAGFTITAHASGGGWPAAIADWLHLLAAALWVGGLAALLLTLRSLRGTPQLRARETSTTTSQAVLPGLVRRFSNVAAVCLGVLLVTGLYSSWLHVPGLRALAVTAYGRTLALKGLLIVPLVLLGAINHFILRPRLAADPAAGNPVLRRLLRVVTGEIGLGVLILLVVAALTITPPARVTLPVAAREPLVLAGIAGGVKVRLTITPAQPGWNRYEVEATAAGDQIPAGPGVRLLLRLKKLDEDLAPVTVTLQPGAGRYAAAGGELALPGWWELEVVVRRRGRLDVSTAFPLLLEKGPPRASDPAAQALLDRARRATRALRGWRETEQLTDGKGNVVVADYDLVPPNRLRYRTSAGNEAVIIGTTRYTRTGPGDWERDTLPQALTLEGPLLYMRDAERVMLGRRDRCGPEDCQVVLWQLSGGSASFAAWIGTSSGRVHRLLMVAGAHYMTLRAGDFNAPITIAPPR